MKEFIRSVLWPIQDDWSIGNPDESLWVEFRIKLTGRLVREWVERMTLSELEGWLGWFQLDVKAKEVAGARTALVQQLFKEGDKQDEK